MRANDSELFVKFLRTNDAWLMERILYYAHLYDYTKYTSTLVSAWRLSIVGLNDSIEELLLQNLENIELNPDDSYQNDPASAFGVVEAQKHRMRGVSLSMFFSLFKYYRQSYKDLMGLKKDEFEDFGHWNNFVERFFDRVETAYCTEWAGRSPEEQIRELSSKNRLLSNEKNRYLTVFESLEYPALIMNDEGVIENYNAAAGRLLFNDARKGWYYYDDNKEVLRLDWLSSKIDAQDTKKFTQTVVHNEKSYFFDVLLSPLQDVSGKNDGFVALMHDNTDLLAKQQEVEYDNGFLKALLDAQSDIVLATDGIGIVSCNRRFLDFTGYETLEKFGEEHRCICDFFVKREGYLEAEMGGKSWIKYAADKPFETHLAMLSYRDKTHTFKVSARDVNNGKEGLFVCVMTDVTDIQEIKQRYEYALTGANEGIWDWNLETNEVYFSPRWKEMLGFADDELPCEFSSWKDRVHPDDLQMAIDEINDHITKKTDFYYCEHRLRHKDGSWVWIMDKGKAFYDDNGKPLRMVGTHTDMTYIKENEQKLKDMQNILAAQSRYAAMGEMIGMIAHQWRQPITAIGMAANNMSLDIQIGEIDAEAFRKHLESIDSQVQFLSHTIDDFRNFFKPNKEMETVYVCDIVDSALKIIGKSLENNAIEVRKNMDYNCQIEVYKSELIQVLLVILGNAKDAVAECGTKLPLITITSAKNPDFKDCVELCICDNGGGVPEGLMQKIFEPYFTTKEAKNGTGLGLYIAKTITEKHQGGSMGAKNKGDGACFWIRLPIVKTEQG